MFTIPVIEKNCRPGLSFQQRMWMVRGKLGIGTGTGTIKFGLLLKAMPHGSEKSPEKNRNEIRHSLCMPHGRVKIVANYEENDT